MPAAVTIPKIAGEVIVVGQLLAIDNSGGSPRIFLCDAAGAGGDERKNAYAIANTSAALGATVSCMIVGEKAVADAYWVGGVPAVGDVGKIVYSTETPGSYSLTPPATPTSVTQKVGEVSVGGAGAVKVTIQFGDAG